MRSVHRKAKQIMTESDLLLNDGTNVWWKRFASTECTSVFTFWICTMKKTRLSVALTFIVRIINGVAHLMYLFEFNALFFDALLLFCFELDERISIMYVQRMFCRCFCCVLSIDWMCSKNWMFQVMRQAIVSETIRSTGRPSTDNGHHATKRPNENEVFSRRQKRPAHKTLRNRLKCHSTWSFILRKLTNTVRGFNVV